MRGRRRLVLAAAAVLVAGTASAVAFAGSSGQDPRVTHRLFPNAVSFVDRMHGVLGTGYRYSGHEGGAIELTSNGGKTWQVALRTPRPVIALFPVGSYLYAQFDDGEMLQSRDAGRTWRPSTSQVWPPASSVCPMGDYVGYNGGDPSWSLCTTQGGAGNEGKAVYRNLPSRGWTRVACTNFANSHFLCGKDASGGISSLGYPLGIAGNARGGFAVVWESRGTIWTTRDGGKHWTGHQKLAESDVDFGSWASVAPRGGVGYVILTRGTDTARLVETTDAGRTWRVVRRWQTPFR
jgi:photosystem II stability/assembly factor-like uncharacterized protein